MSKRQTYVARLTQDNWATLHTIQPITCALFVLFPFRGWEIFNFYTGTAAAEAAGYDLVTKGRGITDYRIVAASLKQSEASK